VSPTAPLPIDAVLGDLKAVLDRSFLAVLQAPPGAGKTTRVPLALLDQSWLSDQRIVMLEPRRLAARAAARFMSRRIGEKIGGKVGYRVRMDARVSKDTRIEVVTEGVFVRRLQSDPSLDGVGLVIFDEFHERSLEADLALALARDARQGLRPDLRLLVMSATLDGARLSAFLDNAPVVRSEGRAFPVAVHHLPSSPTGTLEDTVARAVRDAVTENAGSALVFLPGEREIRRVAERLGVADLPADVDVRPLYGALSAEVQDQAIAPPPQGRRKIVLATSIAETSLTIEGVRIVVDSGYRRAPRFEPRTGMTRLHTERISRAAAVQRQGRAGRLEPGVCFRLWTSAAERGLPAFDTPEILQADLTPLALVLAEWGIADPAQLSWLDPPPPGALAQARDLLRMLEALDDDLRPTPTGRAMAALPVHPRLAHMIVRGTAAGVGTLACHVAALLSERDILTDGRVSDIGARLSLLTSGPRSGGRGVRRGALAAARDLSARLRDIARVAGEDTGGGDPGFLVALAYPGRIGQRRGDDGRYRLSGGGSARLPVEDPLFGHDFLAIAETDGAASDARVFLAAPLSRAALDDAFGAQMVDEQSVAWDDREGAVVAQARRRLGQLSLDARPLARPDPAAVGQAVLDGIRRLGLAALPWTDDLQQWRHRVQLLRSSFPDDGWPDVTDAALLTGLENWLLPYLTGVTRRAQFSQIPLRQALETLLSWPLPERLRDLAPERLSVPSGSAAVLRYGSDGPPALRVRLQEVFGLTETPTIAGGRVAVTMELLSPAQRPLAVTGDLASFWRNAYPSVRAEMRGRYPKHHWPEDPIAATPTRTTKRRRP